MTRNGEFHHSAILSSNKGHYSLVAEHFSQFRERNKDLDIFEEKVNLVINP